MEDDCKECIHGDNCPGTEPGGECQGTYFFKPKNARPQVCSKDLLSAGWLFECDSDFKLFKEKWL